MAVFAVCAALLWIGLLFAVAWYGDRSRNRAGGAWIYTLSLAVYCTSWTYYGSVGLAAEQGLGFLPIYIGPTLVALLFPLFLPRLIALCQRYRVSSVPDLLAARYGKSARLAALATVVAVLGVVPYIALQLRAVDLSFSLLIGREAAQSPALWQQTSLWIAALMAVFAMVFGTRSLQVTEQHRGLVRAIALESLLKLLALLVLAGFVVWGVLGGLGGFRSAMQDQPTQWLQVATSTRAYGDWLVLLLLSMGAVVLLPRQFQMLVVENEDSQHVYTASWAFPLYLLLINLAVLPLALAGRGLFSDTSSADGWVLAIPLLLDQALLAQLVFLGGLSAATGMIIVEATALSTMVSNDLVMPLLLRFRRLPSDFSRRLLQIRRLSMVLILLLGAAYVEATGGQRSLVSMGLVSFAAVAQFLPGVLLGLSSRWVSGRGVATGLLAGFLIWLHTLFVPTVWPAYVNLWPSFLAPHALLTYDGFGVLSHAVFWSLLLNFSLTVLVSLSGSRPAKEIALAEDFVHTMRGGEAGDSPSVWRGGVAMADLHKMLCRVLGEARADRLLAQTGPQLEADARLLEAVERELAAAVGSASARILVSTVATAQEMSQEEIFALLEETSGALRMARELQRKSTALEAASEELRSANRRLLELDAMKDDFVSTVTHELRTPLTSIRAFSEILHDDRNTPEEQRTRFLKIIMDETDRLSRLIEQVLDLARLESGAAQWRHQYLDVHPIAQRAVDVMRSLAEKQGVRLELDCAAQASTVCADADRLHQVLVNLLANALKFCPAQGGHVQLRSHSEASTLSICITDNGAGIPEQEQHQIFDRFRQTKSEGGRKRGSGLGLAISKQIVEHLGGSIQVESTMGQGSRFCITLPLESGDEC